MASPIESSYDALPYTSRPRRNTHPDTLATVARLMGLDAAPVERCRMLEIGCSTGGNLTPIAATLPQSQFVGIDLSSVQIEIAQKTVEALQLKNLTYRAMSLTDLTPEDGEFDYIICHGVFSWVPPLVQEKILEICSKNLAPNGVAYISYNTYPGWYLRMPARDIMLYFLRRVSQAEHRTEAARSFFNFVARSNPNQESVYGQLLNQEATILKDQPDYYLAHEHLDAENRPCYFHEFMDRASQHGLQYVGNSDPEFQLKDLPEEAQEPLQLASTNLIQMEQYIDMVMGRTFRRTLLCHQSVQLNRAPDTEQILSFLVAAGAKPKSDTPQVNSSAIESFTNHRNLEVSTNNPISKAIFWILWRAWPQAVPGTELVQKVQEELGESWGLKAQAARDTIAATLLEGYLSFTVQLHTHIPQFTTSLSQKPCGFELARYLARESSMLPTVRHQEVELSNLERFVLGHLDGSRSRDDLLVIVQAALEQKLFPGPEGDLASAVDAALQKLAESTLLVA